MRILKIALATAAVVGFASTASAQDSGAYVNIGVDAYEFDAYAISGKIGYNINDYFGVEGQAAFGIVDDKETFGGTEFKVGVDSAFGGFAVLRFPASESFDVFARAGYQTTKIGASGGGQSESGSFDGLALGAGGQYFFTENDGIRLEYTYLDLPEDAGNGNVFSLSYVRNF